MIFMARCSPMMHDWRCIREAKEEEASSRPQQMLPTVGAVVMAAVEETEDEDVVVMDHNAAPVVDPPSQEDKNPMPNLSARSVKSMAMKRRSAGTDMMKMRGSTPPRQPEQPLQGPRSSPHRQWCRYADPKHWQHNLTYP